MAAVEVEPRAVTQRLDDVEIPRTARGTTTGLAVLAEHEDRAFDLLRKLARYQPDDAFRPLELIAVHQHHRVALLPLRLLAHALHQLLGDQLARLVEFLQLPGLRLRFCLVIRCQQLESDTGMLHTPGGVDARSQGVGDIALAPSARL